MLKDYRAVRAVAAKIAEAAEVTIEAYRVGRITDEPHITDRLMGTIEEKVRGLVTPVRLGGLDELEVRLEYPVEKHRRIDVAVFGKIDRTLLKTPIRWEAKTLRAGSGAAAEEKRFGADILGVLSIDIDEYSTNKGFLAQAKRVEPGALLSNAEWDRLVNQCEAMLASTRDSYVVAYSKTAGVRFFSAQAVVSYQGRDLFELYHLSTRTFFERHLQSFIGDQNLNRPDISVLKNLQALRDERGASMHVLQVKGLSVLTEISE